MKKFTVFLFLFILCTLTAQEDKLTLNVVLFSEVNMKTCDEQESVLFQSPVISNQIENYAERNEFIEEIKQSYKAYLEELINSKYPQYYLKDCIPEVEEWAFFEESNFTDAIQLKESISSNYEGIEIIETDFGYQTKKPVVKEPVDPKIAIVKAYYNEALILFNNNNFEKTIDVLNIAKSNLEGKVNTDVILLEAKARYAIDKNINQAKYLFNTFIDEAAKSNDKRIQEAAKMIVQIETSGDFHETGFRKILEKEISVGNELIVNKDFINRDGTVSKTQQFKKNWGNAIYKEIDFESKKGKRVSYFNKDQSLAKVAYYVNDIINTMVFGNYQKLYHYSNGELVQEVNFNTNDVIDISVYKEYKSENENQVYLKLSNALVLETYPIDFEIVSSQNVFDHLGMVKKIKITYEKEDFDTYVFDKYGIPLEKTYYNKRGKLKDNYKFNTNTFTWEEL